MSGSQAATVPLAGTFGQLHAILRYAAGSTVILMVAMGWDYSLAYLTPVLALNFLGPSAKAPTLKGSAAFLLMVALSCLLGLAFSHFFLGYPLVFLPLLALMLFHIYYTDKLKPMKLWLIISLLVIPMMMMQSTALGSIIAVNLFMNALLALSMAWIVWFILPGKDAESTRPETIGTNIPGRHERFILAVTQSLVVIPVLTVFFIFNLSGSVLILIFVAVLSMNPAMVSKKAGKGLILANLGGGLAAILVYNLLTVAPSYLFSGFLTLLAGLLFAPGIFSGKPVAALTGMAFSTFLLIQGNVVSMAGEAGEVMWGRVMQIGIVMIYLVLGFRIAYRIIMKNLN
jgi:hypothetical protein